MLVLSRKESESVLLGENIVVKIISIDRGTVKIGFEAPSDCIILREELKAAVENENKKASVEVSDDVLKALESKINIKK